MSNNTIIYNLPAITLGLQIGLIFGRIIGWHQWPWWATMAPALICAVMILICYAIISIRYLTTERRIRHSEVIRKSNHERR